MNIIPSIEHVSPPPHPWRCTSRIRSGPNLQIFISFRVIRGHCFTPIKVDGFRSTPNEYTYVFKLNHDIIIIIYIVITNMVNYYHIINRREQERILYESALPYS